MSPTGDLDSSKTLPETLSLLGSTVQLYRTTLPKNDVYHDTNYLSDKLLFHAATAYHITTNGTPFSLNSDPAIRYTDLPSVVVLSRAVLETYLLFFHIFVDTISDNDLFSFRHSLWHLDSLLFRQGPAVADRSRIRNTEIIKALLIVEPAEIKRLRSIVQKTTAFANLDVKVQAKVQNGPELKDNWWRPGWKDIAINAGFGATYARRIYSYFSLYAHSGYISVFQTDQMSPSERREVALERLPFIEIIAAKMIFDFTQLAPALTTQLDSQSPAAFARVKVLSSIPNKLP